MSVKMDRPEEHQGEPSSILTDAARLATLDATGLLDGEAEPSFDRLARLASEFLGAPVALVSLVTADRQFFKSCVGLPEPWASRRETPLSHSFCQHVVRSGLPLVIDDARLDDRVKDNLAIPDLGVVAYLGVPLSIDGQVIGSFCAIDGRPRTWSEKDVSVLSDLAESVVSEIRLRADRDLRAQQYAAAENARQQLQVTLGSIGDGVIATDAEGLVTFLNPVAGRLIGSPPSLADGRPLEDLFRLLDPGTRRRAENPALLVLGQVPDAERSGESLLQGLDGKEHRIEHIATPIRSANGRIRGVVIVFRDVTRRRQMDLELARNEERLRIALDAARMVAWEWTPGDGTLHASDNAWHVFGLDDKLATLDQRSSILHVEDRERYRDACRKAVEDLGPYFHRYRMVRPSDGKVIWIEERGHAFPVGAPGGVRLTGVAVDVTEREHLVEQLRDADARKDEFLAMLAHELRNPLGVISNAVHLVQAVEGPEVLAEILEMIQHQVRHLTHLIDDLLDVSRITQGKIELKKRAVELTEVVGRALEAVKPLVQEKWHELTSALPDRPTWFVADPTRTEQILGNLLTNAAKYSPPGGSIHLAASVEAGEVIVRVRDAGDGISAEMLPKIFDLFTQVDATIDRSRGGLGIGLTLVKNLAEMHGGSVSAASDGKGRGSEFTIRLPVGEPSRDLREKPAAPSKLVGGTGRVLIIDDNVETVRLTARMLRFYGYQVETAHDGLEGVELARQHRPEIVLLDIGLPGMNGYEVAAHLRREDWCRDSRLIAISGYGEEKSRERSKAAGFDYHLTKPVNFDVLRELLAEISA